ncbi:osmoprotectant transport system permease protein [Kineococcus radiotolerans]|uniref:Binding-protein-dependent transport systems inner membrane component n=2 Tax=Kineococcus radiotolerans TaxID=131568 RepID=A6W7J0_KINRD|nr:ABC transporter permease subunit [Kineococcus radiotolerans]ABS02779.1 binding-protein-dependent transport systems inner membrane component [Kineococcus radiotolerans SRS30216 = ATCC BAA-149]MBB2900028.1 osmoprotectant transport system permease protein [Kineococcus radiotolerans]
MNGILDYLSGNSGLVLDALGQHVLLAVLPLVIGVALALPIGYLGVRFGWLYQPLLGVSGIVYAIPSLAVFVTLPYVLGTRILSPVNIVVALTIYTIALMARTVADGLRSVDPTLTEAATAMGYRRTRRLLEVELPLAAPVVLAGVRVAAVSNISLVSVGALLGVGGLGALFTRGFQLFYTAPIVVGIVLSIALAAIADVVIVLFQRAVTPWTRLERGA